MTRHNVYRDGRVHVQAQMCSTCIFRPGNLMDLNAGRVRSMVDEAREHDSAIVCHQTLTGTTRCAAASLSAGRRRRSSSPSGWAW
jgi:hypothetical protein